MCSGRLCFKIDKVLIFFTSSYTFVPGAEADGSLFLLILSSFSAFAIAASMYGRRIWYMSVRFFTYSPTPREVSISVSFGQ